MSIRSRADEQSAVCPLNLNGATSAVRDGLDWSFSSWPDCNVRDRQTACGLGPTAMSAAQGRRILMLDFDGVLHPAQGARVPNFAYAPQLSSALTGQACEIVVSSTWREHYALSALQAFLPPELSARVVGVTGPDLLGPHVRYRTIQAWLANHAPDADWRALDDSESEFPAGCPHLILCDGRTGFGIAAAGHLVDWLTSQ